MKPKLLKRFYEALVLLYTLGKNRGGPTAEEEIENEPDPEQMDSIRLRRSFVRNLAYLCDFETGGDRVAAIALENTPQGTIYHLATNKCPDIESGANDRVIEFLQAVLLMLSKSSLDAVKELEDGLFEKAVKFSSSRIQDYAKRLESQVERILNHLNNSHSNKGEFT